MLAGLNKLLKITAESRATFLIGLVSTLLGVEVVCEHGSLDAVMIKPNAGVLKDQSVTINLSLDQFTLLISMDKDYFNEKGVVEAISEICMVLMAEQIGEKIKEEVKVDNKIADQFRVEICSGYFKGLSFSIPKSASLIDVNRIFFEKIICAQRPSHIFFDAEGEPDSFTLPTINA
jgi:hypothetical protein